MPGTVSTGYTTLGHSVTEPERKAPASRSSSVQINGVEKHACREMHIAYRYGDHYDSVRRIGDNTESPAQLRIEVRARTHTRTHTPSTKH